MFEKEEKDEEAPQTRSNEITDRALLKLRNVEKN